MKKIAGLEDELPPFERPPFTLVSVESLLPLLLPFALPLLFDEPPLDDPLLPDVPLLPFAGPSPLPLPFPFAFPFDELLPPLDDPLLPLPLSVVPLLLPLELPFAFPLELPLLFDEPPLDDPLLPDVPLLPFAEPLPLPLPFPFAFPFDERLLDEPLLDEPLLFEFLPFVVVMTPARASLKSAQTSAATTTTLEICLKCIVLANPSTV